RTLPGVYFHRAVPDPGPQVFLAAAVRSGVLEARRQREFGRLPERAALQPGQVGPCQQQEGDEHRDRVAGQSQEWRGAEDRKSTRLNSSHVTISYAVVCLKKIT